MQLQIAVCVLQASNIQRGVCIPIFGALTLSSRAQPSPQQAFCLCVGSLFHLLLDYFVSKTQLHCADICMWFLFPVIEMSQVNYIKNGVEKRVLCRASAAEAASPHAVCGPHSGSLAAALTKEGFPHFYCKTEKHVLSNSGENVTPLKFPAFLSCLNSAPGRN